MLVSPPGLWSFLQNILGEKSVSQLLLASLNSLQGGSSFQSNLPVLEIALACGIKQRAFHIKEINMAVITKGGCHSLTCEIFRSVHKKIGQFIVILEIL